MARLPQGARAVKTHPKFTDPVVSHEIREAEDWLASPAFQTEHTRLVAELNALRLEMSARGIPPRAARALMLTLHVEAMAHGGRRHPNPKLFASFVTNEISRRIFEANDLSAPAIILDDL
jgi:hypothetical protein